MAISVINRSASSGGLQPQIVVTAPSGSTVTAKKMKLNPDYVGLPSGYTQVEYIQSSGTQYIDTRITPTSATRFELKFYPTIALSSTVCSVFGGYDDNYSSNGYYNLDYKTGGGMFYCGNNTNAYLQANTYNEISYDGTTLTYNTGSTAITCTVTNQQYTIYLFARSHGNALDSTQAPLPMKCYEFKLSDGETETIHLIPCIRDSDSAVGMYDLVSEAFFGNSGTGTFTAGDALTMTGFTLHASEYGTYRITATTDTDETKTVDVLVDVLDDYFIEIKNKLYLYNHGDLCTDISGGWIQASHARNTPSSRWGTITNYPDEGYLYMTQTGSGNANSGVITNSAVDATGYTKFCATMSDVTSSAHTCTLFVSNDDSGYGYAYNTPLTYVEFTAATAEQTVELELTEDYNAHFGVRYNSNGTTWSTKIYAIWLES